MKKVIRDAGAGKRIGNYVVAKFQESIKDKYILHSSSTKMMTSRQYKDAKSGIQTPKPYVLPKEFDMNNFKSAMKARADLESKTHQKTEVTMTPMKQNDTESMINIPGLTDKKFQTKKAPLIEEVIRKSEPKVEESQTISSICLVFTVPSEESAKLIDLDVSSTGVKLESKYYSWQKEYSGFSLNVGSVKCKFSKLKRTLTLTINKE